MAHLVRNGQITSDCWQLHETAQALDTALRGNLATTLGMLVTLPLWLERRATLTSVPNRLGIVLQGDDAPACIAAELPRFELIAIQIARFTDGRAYSIARLLRGRYGYRGELRARGDVLHDQLYYLTRVGFDAFELRDDQDPRAAAAALRAFSVSYQGSADDPLPLFRRRQAYA